jgi:glycosyltransferase involved in cell wall biosynthesis
VAKLGGWLIVPLISIITPLYQPVLAHLTETVRGVAEQQLPDPWSVEWIVQEDGSECSVEGNLLRQEWISYQANGSHLGVAATRNIGLSRAQGELVQVLDQDDFLLPHALATLAPHFDDPATHWAVGQADDLNEDGTRTAWKSALPLGCLAPGIANTLAIERGGNWSIHCAGLMLRTAILRALGGWVAGWGDDDIVMFAGLSEVAQGYNDPAVTWLYRQHPGQLHRTDVSRAHSTRGRQTALQRVVATRATQLQLTRATFSSPAPPTAGPPEKD